jgi:hypothetical protein
VTEGQMKRYGPGDIVRMQVRVQHKMYLERVFAHFTHEEKPEAIFTLSGEPKFAEEQWAGSLGVARSEVDLEWRLPPETTPGVYQLDRIGFITYSGKGFDRRGEELGEAATTRVEVVPESDEKPGVERLGFL